MFSEGSPWAAPWLRRVLPVVSRIARQHAAATIFTRFMPPERPEQLPGTWQRYYARWREMTRERLDRRLLELVPELSALVPPARVLDKPFYSPFRDTVLPQWLHERGVDALVVSGAETDVCVLAAVLDAVDRGFRVVVARDACCSSADETHDALLSLYGQRFSCQIEVADAEVVLAEWPTLP